MCLFIAALMNSIVAILWFEMVSDSNDWLKYLVGIPSLFMAVFSWCIWLYSVWS